MENWTLIKKSIFCLGSLVIIIMVYLGISMFMADMKREEEERYHRTDNEFLKTIDGAEIFDAYPNHTFELSFEICSQKPGEILVYQQNGDSYRYAFGQWITVTEEYTKVCLLVEPVLVNETVEEAYVSFFGGYGSGVIPTVRDICIVPVENEIKIK